MKFPDIKKVIELIAEPEAGNASYNGEAVELNKPFLSSSKDRLLSVYVKNLGGDVILINFLEKDFLEKSENDEYLSKISENQKCDLDQDVSTPGYWVCKVLNLHVPFMDSVQVFSEELNFLDFSSKTVKSMRDGVQEYMGGEIGMSPADKIFKIYRSPETVTSIIGRLKGLPIIEDHIDPDIIPDRSIIKGNINESEAVEFSESYKDSTLFIRNKVDLNDQGLNCIARGKKQLSLGYKAKLKPHAVYDFEQYNIEPVHLAICYNARGGSILTFEDNKHKGDEMEISFIDEDGKLSLQKVAEMVGSLQEAIKNAPLEEVVSVMPSLQALVESAKVNDPSVESEEDPALKDGDEDPKDKKEEMKDGDYKDEGESADEEMKGEDMEEEEEESFSDSQQFKDAVNSVVAEKIHVIEKAKNFLPSDFNFVDSSVLEIQKAAVEKVHSDKFEDSEIPVAFKMLKKQSKYQDFGDSKTDAWEKTKNTEI